MGDAFAASGLRDAGYTILRIDGGWWGDDGDRRWWYWTEAGKYADGAEYRPGDPHVDPKNYPGGVRPLADYLHKKGLKLGFYLAPEISTGEPDNYPGNKDRKEPPPVTGLDLVDQHAKWVADNGLDHLFYDGYDWEEKKGLEPYTRMFADLRKEANAWTGPSSSPSTAAGRPVRATGPTSGAPAPTSTARGRASWRTWGRSPTRSRRATAGGTTRTV